MSPVVLLLLALLSLPAYAAGDAPGAGADFAWGMTLTPRDNKAFYSLELPLSVYRGVLNESLADLRVFNAQGEVVPHELRLMPVPGSTDQVLDVPLFPIYANQEADMGTLTLKIEKQSAEGLATLETSQPLRSSEEVLRAYVLRLPELLQGEFYRTLEVDWPRPEGTGFIQSITVEYSRDLKNWRPWKQQLSFIDLRSIGSDKSKLRQNSFSLVGMPDRYLRISSHNGAAMKPLNSARVQIRRGDPRVLAYQDMKVETRKSKGDPGIILFDLPGPINLENIGIWPQDINTYVKIRLYSRAAEQQPWRLRLTEEVYLQTQGESTRNRTRFSLPSIRDRYWKLETDGKGGGFGNRPPNIIVSWIPHTLLFAARGGGPFTLAWGSRRAGSKPAASPGLFAFQEGRARDQLSTRIVLGTPYELAGMRALSATPTPADWKRWLLWGLLGLSVLLLGWMAWRTLKQISAN